MGLKRIMICLCFIVLVGCGQTRLHAEDDTVFFAETAFTVHVFEADFHDEDSFDYYYNTYTFFDWPFATARSLAHAFRALNNHPHIHVVLDDWETVEECPRTICQYVMIPLFSHNIIMHTRLQAAFIEGELALSLVPLPSIYPATDVKMVVIRIESPYGYTLTVNPANDGEGNWHLIGEQ